MIKFIQKYPLLIIAIYTLALLLPNLNALEVGIMEARNFISAREMLTEGNWILTTLNEVPRYSKPPLPTWITAGFGFVFGQDNFYALRLPGVLMIIALGMGVYALSRKLNLKQSYSLYNALISITSAYVVLIIFDAPWDIYAFTFILWAIYFMLRWFKKEKVIQSGMLAVIFIGASILSKGPVALYVLLLSFLISYFSCFGIKEIRKRGFYFIGILGLGLLLGFSWYLYVKFADATNFNRIISQETGNWASYNVRPFYYYWNFVVQSGVWTIPAFVSLLYPYLKTKVSNPRVYRFTMFWTILSVVLLSIIPEKKSRYLMPVLVPLAINSGFYIQYLIENFRLLTDWREKIPVYLHFGIIGLVFVCSIPLVAVAPIFGDIPWYVYVLLLIPLGLGLFLFKELVLEKNIKLVFYISLLGILCIGFALTPIAKSSITNAEYRTFKELSNPTHLPVYAYDMSIPELVWEYGKQLPSIDREDLVSDSLESQFLVLECATCEHNLEEAFKGYTLQLMDTINLNKVATGAKNYRYRKTSRVFLATRH